LKCLDKDQKKRYVSAQALADDLERFLDNRTILARRSSVPERALKWIRRKPALASLAILSIVTALLGITSLVLIQQQRADRLATQLADLQKAEETRNQVVTLLARGDGRLALKEWQLAYNDAEAALARIDPGADQLADLRDRASALKDQAETELRKRQAD